MNSTPIFFFARKRRKRKTETETWKRKHGKYCACSQVPSSTADLISDSSLAHVFFESVSAPILSGSHIKVAYSVARSVCSFIYSMSGDEDCILHAISSDLLRARMKTCCQSRSNGSALWRLLPRTLVRVTWSGLGAIVYSSLTELSYIALYSGV